MRRLWNWHLVLALAIAVPLTLIDLGFLASNSLKIPDGGWFPLVVGAVVFTLLTTWKRGRALLTDKLSDEALPLAVFLQSIEVAPPTRVEGTAVFMTSTPDHVPHALLHNLKHNKVLHQPRRVPHRRHARHSRSSRQTSASRSRRWAATSTSSSRTTDSRRTRTCRNCSTHPAATASPSR